MRYNLHGEKRMFANTLAIVRDSKHRTIVNTAGKVVRVTDAVASAGLNLIGSVLAHMLGVYGNILEHAIKTQRAVVFHDSIRMETIVTAFPNVVLLGGTSPGAQLQAGDGDLLADLAAANPKTTMLINLAGMDVDDAARLLGDFAVRYGQHRHLNSPPELFSIVGVNRIMSRQRHHTGDSRSIRDVMHQHIVAPELNLRLVNVMQAFSEAPFEFHTNTPNIAVFKLNIARHIRDLNTHVLPEHAKLVGQMANDAECGVMHMERGYATLFNPSDLPNEMYHRFPYILEEEANESDIGQIPPTSGRSYGNAGPRDALMKSLREARKEKADKAKATAKADEKEAKRAEEKAVRKAVAKALRRKAIMAEEAAKLRVTRMGAPAKPARHAGGRVSLNALVGGGSMCTFLMEQGLELHVNEVTCAAAGLAAYRQTDGRTVTGQMIDRKNLLEAFQGIDVETAKLSRALAHRLGVGASRLLIAAGIIARRDGTKSEPFLETLSSMKPDDAAVRKIAGMISGGKAGADAVNTALLTLARPVAAGAPVAANDEATGMAKAA